MFDVYVIYDVLSHHGYLTSERTAKFAVILCRFILLFCPPRCFATCLHLPLSLHNMRLFVYLFALLALSLAGRISSAKVDRQHRLLLRLCGT